MTSPDDLTRQLLAPRQRSRPADSAKPPPAPPRRTRWRLGATLALLGAAIAAAALAGQWLRQSMRSGAAPAAAITQQQVAPRSAAGTASGPAQAPLAAVTPASPKVSAPMATLSELLQRPASGQLRWARFKANPAIVVIEYPTLLEQGLAMNRLAAMFEKRTARNDRVPTEGELAELLRRSGDTTATFYQGHDYPAAKVARFFSLAVAQSATLNAQEMQLRSLMLEAGLIRPGVAGAFQATGEQAVISFTSVQSEDSATAPDERVDIVRREAVLHHELSHGEFFTSPDYRAHCMKFWRHVLSGGERKMFSAYLKSLDYNPGDEELMANETQALLMHTPDSRAFNAGSLGISESALAQLRSRFQASEPAHGLRP